MPEEKKKILIVGADPARWNISRRQPKQPPEKPMS